MARRNRMTLREMGIVALLIILIAWLSTLVVGIFKKEQIARTTVQETRAELTTLESRRATLAATDQELTTERGKDASLRETFGVAKPGEEVIIVVPKQELPPPPGPTLWQKIKDFFAGIV